MNNDMKQKREEAYEEYLLKFMQGYFDNRRDEEGMKDWVKLMNLGCFGQEFHIYALAYEDEQGIAYRCSAKANKLFDFAKTCAVYGYYPTAVTANIQRRTCPSGCEDTIKSWLKKETAYLLRENYNKTYFKGMKILGKTAASNAALPILKNIQENMEGRYILSELNLFEGLVLEAVRQKKLTGEYYWQFNSWIRDMHKQMADEMQIRGRYEKLLSGFAYVEQDGKTGYFTDAFLQTTYESHQQYELEGKIVTPIYEKKYWLQEISQFREIKMEFEKHLWQCFDEQYFAIFNALRGLPSVIAQDSYQEVAQEIKEKCSPQAYQNLQRYARRWGIEISNR